MFATGIENSYPTIDHGKTRVDQMAVCGHYDRWREDFDCVQEIGINYLRYGPPIHKTYLGPEQVRLGIRRPDLRRFEEARDHADRRFVPFRRARLARQFPEPRFPAPVRRLCRGVRRALPVGAALHADQRDVHLRGLLRQIRLVERAEEGRHVLHHRAQAHRQSQRHGDDRDPQAAPRRDFHPVGIVGILSCRQSRRDRPRRSAQPDALPQPRPQLRSAGRQRHVPVSARQRHDPR